ncbi:MAG TPA: hypothetical protein VM282_22840 [Acidimicrobiales bacterium]|nr:hypothetical protein [Acidimicrobiales bacterium]
MTEPFERVARSSAIARGLSKLPIVVLPADFNDYEIGAIRSLVDERLGEVESALLRGRG